LFSLKPWQKLIGQLLAAVAASAAGIGIHSVAGHAFAHWLTLPMTILWLVLCTNAINLIDGVDGLAAGVGLFASATTLLAALLQNNFSLAAATMPIVGALLGFLRYNFNPATVFLGDSGSLLLGFLLGSYSVLWSQKSATLVGMTAPLMALSIPLLDTALAIIRRFLRRKSIFVADRGHIHHRLLDRGLTPRKVALILYALSCIVAVFSLCISTHRFDGLVIIVFCGAAWIGIQQLGYIELRVAGRMFLEGAFRRQLSTQIALEHHENLLDAAGTVQECWSVIENASREFGFCGARLILRDQAFAYSTNPAYGQIWHIVVPFEEEGSLELRRKLGETWPSGAIAPFVEMLTRTLSPKIASLLHREAASQVAGFG
jgi:UDP-GlcNAc:undecaprenyl-phosphate GlcNAc-1-phosphate transferase